MAKELKAICVELNDRHVGIIERVAKSMDSTRPNNSSAIRMLIDLGFGVFEVQRRQIAMALSNHNDDLETCLPVAVSDDPSGGENE